LDSNPIAESMRLTVAGVGDPKNVDLRIKNPRPIEYRSPLSPMAKTDPVFLLTDPAGWKEAQPFATEERTPEPDSRTNGQWPIGVAVEARLPATWQPERERVRVAAIGHGGVFSGLKLSPVREKLLLDTCNWLLGRDDLLSSPHEEWAYPRVGLSEEANMLWQWGTRLGIPLAFVFAGVVVLWRRAGRWFRGLGFVPFEEPCDAHHEPARCP